MSGSTASSSSSASGIASSTSSDGGSYLGPPPPNDESLRRRIDGFARFIARHGPEVEVASMRKNVRDPRFSFLFVGDSPECQYYRYRLRMERSAMGKRTFESITTSPGSVKNFVIFSGNASMTGSQSVLMSGNELLAKSTSKSSNSSSSSSTAYSSSSRH